MHIPPSFLLIKKGNLSILLKENYKDLLFISDEKYLKNLILSQQSFAFYFEGRRPYPSILLNNGQRVIIRKYHHGGIFGNFGKDLYLFGSRAFKELILTEEVRACGIPTSEPVCAIHQSIFPFFYKAYLLSLEIPDAHDLKRFLIEIGKELSPQNLIIKRRIIRSIGSLVKKFHDNGFFHRDLQLKNILVSRGQTFIIDFDRCYRKSQLSLKQKINNILRLKRSVEKWKRTGLPVTRTDQMRFFLSYIEGDLTIRSSIKKALHFYKLLYPIHQLSWFIKGKESK